MADLQSSGVDPSVARLVPGQSRNTTAKWVFVALVASFALALQLAVFPNHDVAWVLWGTRALLHGARWGRDIIEPNPPLAWYLAMPSTWLAERVGAPVSAAFDFFVAMAALAAIFAFDAIVMRCRQDGRAPGALPTLIAALFLLVLPQRDFGQREHLMLIAALPYLALVAARSSGDRAASRGAAIAIGLAAGLGFALKPYFLAIPLLVEAMAVFSMRRLSPFRPETIAMAAVVGLYGLGVLLFCRPYVETVVPLAQAIYWSFDTPLIGWLPQLALPLFVVVVTALAARRRALHLPLILCAATAGFAISCLLQHKGYSYHLFPVSAGAALAAAALPSWPGERLAVTRIMLGILLPLSAWQTVTWWVANRPGGIRTIETGRIIGAIDRYAGAGGFLAVAVHPFPAFPAALYVRARQVSRTNSQWFLPTVAELRDGVVAPAPQVRDVAERNARAFILHDLAQHPDLVMIDTDSRRHTIARDDFDFLAFYKEDPRFRAAWARYREIAPLGAYRLFVRAGEGGQ